MKRTDTIERLHLCGGTLAAWERSEVPTAYDEDEGEVEYWAEFESGGAKTEIHSAEDLYRALIAQGCNLASEIAPLAGRLAHLTAIFLEQGRAVTDPLLYEGLEKSHSLKLRDHLPRVEGHLFRFLLADYSKPRQPRLTDVAIDLRTGAIARQPLRS